MMMPLNEDVVPSVAELPTCQKTLRAFAPLMRITSLLVAVVRLESINIYLNIFASSSTVSYAYEYFT